MGLVVQPSAACHTLGYERHPTEGRIRRLHKPHEAIPIHPISDCPSPSSHLMWDGVLKVDTGFLGDRCSEDASTIELFQIRS
ncbi:hypothetical protein [Halocatena marina]|uniref:hypothetical protein n=1 Tax=Halocatena marina TaxID=2934937 RepID=UPI0036F3C9F3